MDIYQLLRIESVKAFDELFHHQIEEDQIQIEQTSADHEGDLTLVVFPLLRFSRKSPVETANLLGKKLQEVSEFVENYKVIKGFLNLQIAQIYWLNHLSSLLKHDNIQVKTNPKPLTYLIEYSSPNTNKPLHLGHIRNNLIGHSVSEILLARGHEVIKANLINDRGIHICKSMVGWLKAGQGKTPETTGQKGDHFVGDYYVLFDQLYKKEMEQLIKNGSSAEDAEKKAPIMLEAQQILKLWEKNDDETRRIWTEMNSWVYQGFEKTYRRMGVSFDKVYYESDTYLLGKKLVKEGLEKGLFFSREDQSIWVDLQPDGLDEKLLIRPDGTSVYMTQDLGTAQLKHDDFCPDQSIYIVGNEQEYHFKVLRLILKKLGKSYADTIKHLSYGMVDLPEGKMKSREGTVVDADDLMDEMKQTALDYINESGKSTPMEESEKVALCEIVGLAALKFFILKTDVKKRMVFNPEESIDFQGHTGPFVQYTFARINSILEKSKISNVRELIFDFDFELEIIEMDLLKKLYYFNDAIAEAEREMDPSQLANYIYQLAKLYNRFYHDLPILKEVSANKKYFRLQMSFVVSRLIEYFMNLLGIQVPKRM